MIYRTFWSLPTEETISGIRAAQISRSGNLRIAMASISGRMPAVGIIVDNIFSGGIANIYQYGMFQTTSGLVDYSGLLGSPVWVGRSGHVVQWSGSWNSGGFNISSGQDIIQRLGIAINSGAFGVNIALDTKQRMGISGLALAGSIFLDLIERLMGG